MTHQTSGQWDKEYPGHRASRDQLFGGKCGCPPWTSCKNTSSSQVLDKWTPLRASRTSTNRNKNFTLPCQLHTNNGGKNTTANICSLLFFHAHDKYWAINSCNNPVSRYWVIIPILRDKTSEERLSNVTTVTQRVSGEIEILTQIV